MSATVTARCNTFTPGEADSTGPTLRASVFPYAAQFRGAGQT